MLTGPRYRPERVPPADVCELDHLSVAESAEPLKITTETEKDERDPVRVQLGLRRSRLGSSSARRSGGANDRRMMSRGESLAPLALRLRRAQSEALRKG